MISTKALPVLASVIGGVTIALGATYGFHAGYAGRGISVVRCGVPGADTCYNQDACADSLTCSKVGTVYQIVAPSGYKLWRSGPSTDVMCKRTWSTSPTCVPGTNDTFTSPTCGEKYNVGG